MCVTLCKWDNTFDVVSARLRLRKRYVLTCVSFIMMAYNHRLAFNIKSVAWKLVKVSKNCAIVMAINYFCVICYFYDKKLPFTLIRMPKLQNDISHFCLLYRYLIILILLFNAYLRFAFDDFDVKCAENFNFWCLLFKPCKSTRRCKCVQNADITK